MTPAQGPLETEHSVLIKKLRRREVARDSVFLYSAFSFFGNGPREPAPGFHKIALISFPYLV